MSSERSGSAAFAQGPKYRVLFLDDEDAILSALRSLFRKEGYDLMFFSDPAEALRALQNVPVDLIISDLRMPVLTGTEFLTRAATIQPSPIRIMLSGYEDKPVVINAIAQGLAKDYIMKPWDDLAFRELITDNLALYERLRATALDKLLGRLDAWPLPLPPPLAMTRAVTGGEVSIQDVVAAVERSPSLIARLLRVANSIHYGTRHPIRTVREAVLFVGTEFVVSLLMALESFTEPQHRATPEGRELIERLWQTSIRRATIARAIAKRSEIPDGHHIAFVASLFQEIGFVVRAQTDPPALRHLLHAVDAEHVPILQADASAFRITHDQLGATLLRFWNFPEEIVGAIEGHHDMKDPTAIQSILRVAEEVERISTNGSAGPDASPAAIEWHARIADVVSDLTARGPAD